MRRNNTWIIGILTAAITTLTLSALFGTPYWRPHRHPGHYWRYDHDCDHRQRSDSSAIPSYKEQ